MHTWSGVDGSRSAFEDFGCSKPGIPPSRQPDALIAFEQIGTRLHFKRGQEIYAEGDVADSWYSVMSGTVRICKLLADGRRHIAEFCFAGDCFGLFTLAMRAVSAEAVGEVFVMCYPKHQADRLIDENPRLARDLYHRTVCELAKAQSRTTLLARLTATERVASFLIEVFNRGHAPHTLNLPMTRYDIADYLGLTLETVCRELSALKRDGVIASSGRRSTRIELGDRDALEGLCEAAR